LKVGITFGLSARPTPVVFSNDCVETFRKKKVSSSHERKQLIVLGEKVNGNEGRLISVHISQGLLESRVKL